MSKVLKVPLRVTISGITLNETVSVKKVHTETTTSLVGFVFLDAILCKAITRLLLINTGSTVSCGLAAWPPLPIIFIVKVSAAAKKSPDLMEN